MFKMTNEYLVLPKGGTDINPQLYDQPNHPRTQASDIQRDHEEIHAIKNAVQAKLPIIGVCRGAQLLCVLNGGELYQHTLNHNQSHDTYCYYDEGESFDIIDNVAADHHQTMKLDNIEDPLHIFAFSTHPTKVWDYNRKSTEFESKILHFIPEVVWFPITKSLAIQPHPEWMEDTHPFNEWLAKLIYTLTGVSNVQF